MRGKRNRREQNSNVTIQQSKPALRLVPAQLASELPGNPTVVTNVGGQTPLNVRFRRDRCRTVPVGLRCCCSLINEQRDSQCAVLNTTKLQSTCVIDIKSSMRYPVSANVLSYCTVYSDNLG
jgi:hypothetical protein